MSDKKDLPVGSINFGNSTKGSAAFTGGVAQDFVQGNKIINEAPKPGLPALHQLEPPPVDFVGREAELAELLVMVKEGGVTISGLQGLGGVGKTTLALKLAAELKANYPDAQFLLDLKGPEPNPLPATEALKHVIRAYHPTVSLPESLTELRAQYLSVLEGQRVLLLMDNARDESQIKPLLPPPGCLLLVTSRFHFTVPGLKIKHLDALPPEDAIKLLLEIAPRIGNQAPEIARLCGNLPLGLRVAASFVTQRPNFKVEKLVSKLREKREWMEPIEASLSLSYELLREELQANWRALSVFPDSFDQRAAAAVWSLDEDQTLEQLGELFNFSLVEWNDETDRYRLHDLARVFADSRLTEVEHPNYKQRHAEYYLQILYQSQSRYLEGGEAVKEGLAIYDQEWSNVQIGWRWVKQFAENNPLALELCNEYPNACSSISELRQSPNERIAWRTVALSAAQKLDNKKAEWAHLNHLGVAHLHLGKYQLAIEFCQSALAIAREISDLTSEGLSLGVIGSSYRNLGETRRAIEFFMQHLAITRETKIRRYEGHTLGNLGGAHYQLGELQRAIEFYEQSLAIACEIGDRWAEGHSLCGLGITYAELKDCESAIKFYERHLVIARDLGDRRGEAISSWNMALALNETGYRAEAIALAEAALVLREQIEDPRTAGMRMKLAEWRREGEGANE